jgi:hypothetical protein
MTLETPVWLQHGSFAAQADRTLIDNLYTAGVLDPQATPTPNVVVAASSTQLQVNPNASSLAVDVSAGVCVINGTDQTNQGKYVCRNTAVVTLALTARPASGNTRIDLVYAQVSDSAAGVAGGTDNWILGVVTGTPSTGTPSVPALPTSALALARVTVASGAGATIGSVAGDALVDARVRARSITPAQGWAPAKLSVEGIAGSVSGPIGLVNLTVGPYPTGWTALLHYHCVIGGAGEWPIKILDVNNAFATLTEGRALAITPGGNTVVDAWWIWQQPDGAAHSFQGAADRASGGNGTVYAGHPLHYLEALVTFQP